MQPKQEQDKTASLSISEKARTSEPSSSTTVRSTCLLPPEIVEQIVFAFVVSAFKNAVCYLAIEDNIYALRYARHHFWRRALDTARVSSWFRQIMRRATLKLHKRIYRRGEYLDIRAEQRTVQRSEIEGTTLFPPLRSPELRRISTLLEYVLEDLDMFDKILS